MINDFLVLFTKRYIDKEWKNKLIV